MAIKTSVFLVFLSLLSLSFLYPLRRHHKEAGLAKLLSALMLLPATFCTFLLVKLTLFDNAIVAISHQFSFLPFEFGVFITRENSPLVGAIVLSAVVFSFLLQNQRFVRNIFFFAVALSVLLLISTSVDLLLSSIIFCIGTILLSYFSLREENHDDLVREITKDFFWQRLSDFFAFGALSWMLIGHGFTISLKHPSFFNEDYRVAYGLFFLAITMRIAIMARSLDELSGPSRQAGRNQDLNNLFVGIGALVLLRQFHSLFLGDLNYNKFFIIVSLIIFIEAMIQAAINKDQSKTERNLRYLLVSIALVAQCLNWHIFSTAIICILIIVYPAMPLIIVSMNKFHRSQDKTQPTGTSSSRGNLITTVALKIPGSISLWLSNLFAMVIVPIYSNLLLYRLPQFIIWLVQAPLRLFHTGSIKRSLLLILITLYAYYAAWGPK